MSLNSNLATERLHHRRRSVIFRIKTCISLVFCCACAQADEITEEDILADIPTIMSATRLPQSVHDAPVAITVIDRELIAASGFVDIPDLLRLAPGFQVGLTWRDHHTAFSYHGQSDGLSRRMQVLIDGRVALGSQFGLTDWDMLGITVQDIERIEVVRGSAVAAYGSNAFVGAINIITRDAATSPRWQLSAAAGNDGLEQLNLRFNYSDERLDYQLGLGSYETNGFDGVNDEVDVTSLRLEARYQLTTSQSLDLQLGHSNGFAGRGGGSIPLLDPVGETPVTEDYAVLRWTYAKSPENEWYAQFSYNGNRESDRLNVGTVADFTSMPLPPGVQPDDEVLAGVYDLHAYRADMEVQQILSYGVNSRLVWGVGVRKNGIKGFLSMRGSDYFEDVSGRVYSNWEYRLNQLLLNVGAMFEDGDLANSNLSFRTGINYSLTDDHTVRVSYAEGWRHPFIGEAFHEVGLKTASGFLVEAFLGARQTPSPEKISASELGYLGNLSQGLVTLDIKLFHEVLEREILEVIDPTVPELVSILNPGAFVRVNGGETKIQGVETNVDYRPWDGGRVWLSYAYAEVDQQSPAAALRSLQRLDATPRHTVGVLLSQRFGGSWQASAGYYAMDEMAWQAWGSDLDNYDRVDVRLAKRFQTGETDALLELVGQNILGSAYAEYSINNVFDRRTYIRFSLQFH